jgi:hypothetical protein
MTVSIIALADRPERLPVLVWSLMAQTHQAWELVVLNQSGASDVDRQCGGWKEAAGPRRVQVVDVPRVGDWGQTQKEWAAQTWAHGDVLMFPNDDAYYVPTALATLVESLQAGNDLAVCGWLYDLFNYPRGACGRRRIHGASGSLSVDGLAHQRADR